MSFLRVGEVGAGNKRLKGRRKRQQVGEGDEK